MQGKTPYESLGFTIAILGTAITLLWIGFFKFTPTEAKDIQDVVKHSPFMSWLNSVFSVQGVSNFVGTFEIITAVLLVLQLFWRRLSFVAGGLGALIFLITFSFLFTTPGYVYHSGWTTCSQWFHFERYCFTRNMCAGLTGWNKEN
jgi:uncharacterized membrane protein YkgB